MLCFLQAILFVNGLNGEPVIHSWGQFATLIGLLCKNNISSNVHMIKKPVN